MLSKLFVQFAVLGAAICTVVPTPDLPIPANGKYRIQNAQTGFYMDAFKLRTDPGTPVIVQTLNKPTTSNQEWTLTFDPNSQTGTLKGVKNFMGITIESTGLAVALNSVATNFGILPVTGGALICSPDPTLGCLTSPSDPVTQIPVKARSDGLDQTWIFQAV